MKILLAYDGSQHAQAAVKLVEELSLPPKSKVYLLQVFPPGKTAEVVQLEHGLDAAAEHLQSHGIYVDSELVLGYPAEKIIEVATKIKPDLIVIGAKGLRATLGILLGGVVQQVVEYACCPTLVVRAPYQGLRHILLVSDGSQYSQRAARFLAKFPLPETEKVEIRHMHVMSPLTSVVVMEPYFGGRDAYISMRSAEEEKALMEKQERDGEKLLDRTLNLLQKRGLQSTPVMVRGDAATEIIDYVNAENIDLIVAGSRGLSTFQGWLMGSVSRKLVHYAKCSVLIVRHPGKK